MPWQHFLVVPGWASGLRLFLQPSHMPFPPRKSPPSHLLDHITPHRWFLSVVLGHATNANSQAQSQDLLSEVLGNPNLEKNRILKQRNPTSGLVLQNPSAEEQDLAVAPSSTYKGEKTTFMPTSPSCGVGHLNTSGHTLKY